mgnify:FL=1
MEEPNTGQVLKESNSNSLKANDEYDLEALPTIVDITANTTMIDPAATRITNQQPPLSTEVVT